MHRDACRKWVTVSQDVGQVVPMPLQSVFKKTFRKWSVPKTSQSTIRKNIRWLFHVLAQFPSPQVNLKWIDYYHQKMNVRVAERINNWNHRKLELIASSQLVTHKPNRDTCARKLPKFCFKKLLYFILWICPYYFVHDCSYFSCFEMIEFWKWQWLMCFLKSLPDISVNSLEHTAGTQK